MLGIFNFMLVDDKKFKIVLMVEECFFSDLCLVYVLWNFEELFNVFLLLVCGYVKLMVE